MNQTETTCGECGGIFGHKENCSMLLLPLVDDQGVGILPDDFVAQAGRSAPGHSDMIRAHQRLATPSYMSILHGCIGVVTEIGELMDTFKRYTYYGKPLGQKELDNIEEELGDLMWYVAEICRGTNLSLERVMTKVIDKLKIRYPEKFSEKDALARADKQEPPQILEESGK